MLRSVGEESGCTLEVLVADRQLDLWCLLHVLHPLALYVCSTDVEPVAIQNKPDRDFVWVPGLTTVVSQLRSLFPSHAPQSIQYVGFHKPSLREPVLQPVLHYTSFSCSSVIPK